MLIYQLTSKGLDTLQKLEDKLRLDGTLRGYEIPQLDILRDLTFSPIMVRGVWATPESFAYLLTLERRGLIQKIEDYPEEGPAHKWVFSEEYYRDYGSQDYLPPYPEGPQEPLPGDAR